MNDRVRLCAVLLDVCSFIDLLFSQHRQLIRVETEQGESSNVSSSFEVSNMSIPTRRAWAAAEVQMNANHIHVMNLPPPL